MLQAEGGRDEVTEKRFREPVHRHGKLVRIPVRAVLGQQVIFSDLRDDDRPQRRGHEIGGDQHSDGDLRGVAERCGASR